jgi:hypothetical protein
VNRGYPKRPSHGPGRSIYVLLWTVLLCPLAAGLAAAAPLENHQDLKVLLIVDRPNDPFIERIRAEIAALGLHVLTRGPSGPLEADAREQHAAAAIRILPARNGVEVWMADATTGRTLARQIVVDENPQGPDQSVVALQTAEIVRTGLFPQAAKPPAPTPPPPPPEPPVVIVQAPRTGVEGSVQVGIGALYSPGGAGAALQGLLTVEQRWRRGFGIGLDASAPVLPASLSGPEGSSDVGALSAGLRLFARLPAGESRWFLTAGVGGGVINLRTRGHASLPLTAVSRSVVVGHGYARVDVGWKPASWVKLGLSLLAGSIFEEVTFRFADNQAGTWGSVLLASFLQLGFEWD